MKGFNYYRRHAAASIVALAVLTSCYRLMSTHAPRIVEAGSTFEVSFTVVDDGSDVQNFVTDWSYAGIRLPEGWTVETPQGAHRQYAEDWVYYSDGSKVDSSHDMAECPKLASFYNSACPREGYLWHAFQTVRQVPKNISACWRNGCDSIKVTFLVTVPQGTAPGKYSIDFIGGDEEDGKGVDKYATVAEATSSRLFHVGTVANSCIDNSNTALSLTVEVASGETGIQGAGQNHPSNTGIHALDGRRMPDGRQPRQGIYIKDGRKEVAYKHAH